MYGNNLHIEGLEPGVDATDFSDTPPGVVQTRFFVERERMPFLSEQEGRDVYRNFVYVERKWDLGRSHYIRRINDTVEFDETTHKWKIKRLYPVTLAGDPPMPQSDIKRNTAEWNAFVQGASQADIGTSLELLFRNDPARVEDYKHYHIRSLEALANVTDAMIDHLPMGVRADRERAKAMLQKIAAQAPSIAINNKLEEKDRQIETLSKQVSDLSEKLTKLLSAQMEGLEDEQPKRRGRPRKVEASEDSNLNP